MIAGYGQDDKVCCYTALRAILDTQEPRKTAMCVITDKEEVGFNGVTGMYTNVFDTFIAELLDKGVPVNKIRDVRGTVWLGERQDKIHFEVGGSWDFESVKNYPEFQIYIF